MEKWLREIIPVFDVEHDCILSKQGDITVAFRAELPEIFTLSDEQYEGLHQSWIKAIKVLPKLCVIHKQDWFQQAFYQPVGAENASFLSKAADRHFSGRPYMDHSCYIFITKKPKDRKQSTSLFSTLLRPHIVADQTIKADLLESFLDSCGQFKRILESSGFVRLTRLRDDDLRSSKSGRGIIERYCTLSGEQEPLLLRDIHFGDRMAVGNKKCQLYTLGDIEDLPSLCGSRVNYDRFSTDKSKFSIGFASPLCQLFPYDHIYNQYIFVDDPQKTLHKLERKRLRLQSLSAYSRENAISREATNDFLNEAIGQQRLPVKAHFNILVWSEDAKQLTDIRNQAGTAFAQMDAVAKEETVGAAQIFWAGVPGNAADFPMNDAFDTFLEQSTCFLNCEGTPKSVPKNEGFRFCDRLSNAPVFVDLYDRPRAAGICSSMGTFLTGSSGTGKSVTTNAMLLAMHTQGAHCVVMDIGGSYRGLCEILGGYYFTYEEKNPIRFNPFYLSEGDILDTEKKESLKSLLVALWKQEDEHFNRTEYIALSNALSGYFQFLENDKTVFPCFNTFYEYLSAHYQDIIREHNLKDKDFDLNNFMYVLRPYYKGGEFDYLLNATENLDLLSKSFIVIELDNIKDHPVLFQVVALTTVELVISKMRKLKGVRKVLAIDEAWKAITKSGMAAFMQYAVKTMRKFNGVPFFITQEIDDLLNSPIIKEAIINNCDVKIFLDMRKFMNKFDKIQATLGLSDKAKTILLSVNKDDREVFIDLGGQVQMVYRNELCPEEYYAFTTEGKERYRVLELAQEHGSMEKGIEAMVLEMKSRMRA